MRRGVETWLAGIPQQSTQHTAPPSYDQAINSRAPPFNHHHNTADIDPNSADMFRLNRHDLIRRRDLGLYQGMHPRMIHYYHGHGFNNGGGEGGMTAAAATTTTPRLSLPAAAGGATTSQHGNGGTLYRVGVSANMAPVSPAQPIRVATAAGTTATTTVAPPSTGAYYYGVAGRGNGMLPCRAMPPVSVAYNSPISPVAALGQHHSHQTPTYSIPSPQQLQQQQTTARENNNNNSKDNNNIVVVSDQLPNSCTRSGKHICEYEDLVEDDSVIAAPSTFNAVGGVMQQPPSPLASSQQPVMPATIHHYNHQHRQNQQHHHSRQNSSCSSVSSHGSSIGGGGESCSPPPTGDNYKQDELGAKTKKAKGWTARAGRSATPYGRDSSTDSDKIRSGSGSGSSSHSKKTGGVGNGVRDGLKHRGDTASSISPTLDGMSAELSPAEMDEVLQHLRARMSPVSGQWQICSY